ncbi:MAG TPA: hypothetical protein VM054_11600 [bacterium]|nr:hypothetical protein [bacterium]
MAAFSLLGTILSLLGVLSPDSLPADVFNQPMLTGAPDDSLVAIYVPDLLLDYESLANQPLLAGLFSGWPPEEEDFPQALAQYTLEELFGLVRSELALYLTTPDPDSEWMEPELTLMLRPRNPEIFALLDALVDELGALELPEGFEGFRAFGGEDNVIAYTDELIYSSQSVEELSHVVHHGYGLGDSARFRTCTSQLPKRLALAAYVDLHGLVRLPVYDWWSESYTEPELTPFEERLDAVGVALVPGPDGGIRVDLTLSEGEPVELLDAFGGQSQVNGLMGRYPDHCLIAVEAHLARPLTTLAELGLAFYVQEAAVSVEAIPENKKQLYYLPLPPPPAPEPEMPPEVLAALGELDALAGDTVGMSLHALPGEPQSEVAADFLDDLLDMEVEYADPRLAFYFESPDPAALALGLIALMSVTEGVPAQGEEVTVGGVPGLRLELDEGKSLYLLEFNGCLVVTPDGPSAEFIAENFGGANTLAGDGAFRSSAASTTEPVNLAAWLDMPALLDATEGPDAVYATGMPGMSAGMGFNAAVTGGRVTLEGDSLLAEFILFGLGFFGM